MRHELNIIYHTFAINILIFFSQVNVGELSKLFSTLSHMENDLICGICIIRSLPILS